MLKSNIHNTLIFQRPNSTNTAQNASNSFSPSKSKQTILTAVKNSTE